MIISQSGDCNPEGVECPALPALAGSNVVMATVEEGMSPERFQEILTAGRQSWGLQ